MRPYSNDLRKRVVAARINGEKVAVIAERFSVGVRFVYFQKPGLKPPTFSR